MHVIIYNVYLVAVIAAAWILVQKGRRALTGPLRKVPGPQLNRWTTLPLKLATLRGQKLYYIHALHERYGPLVRVSPDEVAVSDLQATREIHKIGSGFNKSEWYAEFVHEEGARSVFAITDPKEHAQRRRKYARAFSQQALREDEDFIQSRVQMAVAGIKKHAVQGKANILDWTSYMASDIISELAFGKSFECLEHGKKTVYSEDIEQLTMIDGILAELPVLRVLKNVPLRTVKHVLGAVGRVEGYARAAVQRSRGSGAMRKTIFSKVLADRELGVSLADEEIECDAKAFIVAGTDTTAVTYTYLIYAVLKHPELKKQLQDEVDSLPPGFSSEDAQNLRYLNMVLQETLRLYGAAPGSLPRVVPKAGRTLGGYFLPEGVTVSTQAYTLHRDGTIFENPLRFDPQRWQSPTKAMKDAFMPWGGGTRACIGMQLAKMEILLGAATFFRECPTAKIATTTTDEDMKFVNYFLIAPKHHKCEIVL